MANFNRTADEDEGAMPQVQAPDNPGLSKGPSKMFGIIAKMQATAGNRDRLIEILLEGTKNMPGCKLYAIAADMMDDNGIWITEVWESEASHQASLQLPSVQDAIAKGKPLIAGFGDRHVTRPIGGIGISRPLH